MPQPALSRSPARWAPTGAVQGPGPRTEESTTPSRLPPGGRDRATRRGPAVTPTSDFRSPAASPTPTPRPGSMADQDVGSSRRSIGMRPAAGASAESSPASPAFPPAGSVAAAVPAPHSPPDPPKSAAAAAPAAAPPPTDGAAGGSRPPSPHPNEPAEPANRPGDEPSHTQGATPPGDRFSHRAGMNVQVGEPSRVSGTHTRPIHDRSARPSARGLRCPAQPPRVRLVSPPNQDHQAVAVLRPDLSPRHKITTMVRVRRRHWSDNGAAPRSDARAAGDCPQPFPTHAGIARAPPTSASGWPSGGSDR